MCLCLTVTLCDCVNRKGAVSNGPCRRRGLSKKSYFPNQTSKPGSWHTIACHEAIFALGYTGIRNHDVVSQNHSRPFHNWSGPSGNRTGDPHFTSRGNHQILSQKDPLQAVGLLVDWELEITVKVKVYFHSLQYAYIHYIKNCNIGNSKLFSTFKGRWSKSGFLV